AAERDVVLFAADRGPGRPLRPTMVSTHRVHGLDAFDALLGLAICNLPPDDCPNHSPTSRSRARFWTPPTGSVKGLTARPQSRLNSRRTQITTGGANAKATPTLSQGSPVPCPVSHRVAPRAIIAKTPR